MPARHDHAGRTRDVHPIAIRISPGERAALEGAAEKCGVPLSHYVRQAATTAAELDGFPVELRDVSLSIVRPAKKRR